MDLNAFYFPVQEREVLLHPETDRRVRRIPDYKAVVAKINGSEQVVSVVRKSYKLVKNEDLIRPFLDSIDNLGMSWEIDESHTFCAPNRMRLQVTFPEILIRDNESEIPLSIYLHNSYDQSEGVRLYIGGIRKICANGIVYGEIISKLYRRHTSGFTFDKLDEQFENVTGKITEVQRRIKHLNSVPLNEDVMNQLQEALGKRRMQEITQTDRVPDKSMWEMYNAVTHHISHEVDKPRRADLQIKVSRVFQL